MAREHAHLAEEFGLLSGLRSLGRVEGGVPLDPGADVTLVATLAGHSCDICEGRGRGDDGWWVDGEKADFGREEILIVGQAKWNSTWIAMPQGNSEAALEGRKMATGWDDGAENGGLR